jgi:TonB family protein
MRQLQQCLSAALLVLLCTAGALSVRAQAQTGYYTPPKFRNQVRPIYSDAARAAHETGQVLVKVLVDPAGKAKAFSIFKSSGHKDLDNAVLAAVKASTYAPAMRDGKPVTAFYDVTYRFNLRGVAQNIGSESDLGQRLTSNRSDINTRIQLATIYINKHDFAQAESTLEEGGRLQPNNAKVWSRLGIAYYQDASQNNAADKYKLAADAFDKALSIDPHVDTGGTAAAAYAHYAFTLVQQQQYSAALPYARKAQQLNPKLMDYQMLVGEAEEGQGDYATALADFKAAQALDDKHSAVKTAILLTDIGNTQLSLGDEAAGVASIQQAQRVDGHNPAPYQALYAYYIRRGNLSAALVPLQQLAQVQPTNAEVQVNLGDVYLRQKNYAAAQAAYQKAAAISPQSASVQFAMAELAAAQGQSAAADTSLQKAIALSPKDAAAYDTTIANIYLAATSDKADHSADAVRYAQAATVKDPSYAPAWYALGVAYADQRKKAEASDALRKAYGLFKARNDKAAMGQVNQAYKQLNGADIPG